jgi:hypothetical protein
MALEPTVIEGLRHQTTQGHGSWCYHTHGNQDAEVCSLRRLQYVSERNGEELACAELF